MEMLPLQNRFREEGRKYSRIRREGGTLPYKVGEVLEKGIKGADEIKIFRRIRGDSIPVNNKCLQRSRL